MGRHLVGSAPVSCQSYKSQPVHRVLAAAGGGDWGRVGQSGADWSAVGQWGRLGCSGADWGAVGQSGAE